MLPDLEETEASNQAQIANAMAQGMTNMGQV